MARMVRDLKVTGTSGELDPALHARRDLQHYYNGYSRARNVLIRAQGGFRRRPGGPLLGRLPHVLTRIGATQGTQIADDAGTIIGNADSAGYGGEEAAFDGVTASAQAISAFCSSVTGYIGKDWGAATTRTITGFQVWGVTDSGLGASAGNVTVTLQGSTDNFASSVVDLGAITTTDSPGIKVELFSGITVSTAYRYHRLKIYQAGHYIRIAEARFFEGGTADPVTATAPNGGTADNARDEDSATVVLTTTNISTTTPYVVVHFDLGAARTVKFADVRDLKLSAAGSSDDFRIQYSTDDAAWSDFGDPFTDVNETGFSRRRRSASDAGTAARYWRVVRIGATDLGTRKASISGFWLWEEDAALSAARVMGFQFSISQRYELIASDRNVAIYQGDNLVADLWLPYSSAQLPEMNWTQSLDTLISFHKDIQPQRLQRQGLDTAWGDEPQAFTNMPQIDFGSGDEDLWSDARGWPQVGAFAKGRGWYGGSRERPATYATSVSGQFFDLDNSTDDDDKGWVATLDDDQVNEIYNINVGRNIQIFASSGEFYVLPTNATITPKTVDNPKNTNVGSEGPGIRVANVVGTVLFVQALGKAVREFVYTDAEQAYDAERVSLLSSHLISEPVDLTYRRGTRKDEADLVLIVNSEDQGNPELAGSIAALTTLRKQDVTAWQGWHTAGKYIAAGANLDRIIYVAERIVNGTPERFIERFDDDYLTDCGKRVTGAVSAITGLELLEGQELSVIVDGNVIGKKTVASGQIALDEASTSWAECGFDFPDVKELAVAGMVYQGIPNATARKVVYGKRNGTAKGDGVWVRDMPMEPNLPDGTSLGAMKRIFRVAVDVLAARGFYCSANGNTARAASFRRAGAAILDSPPPLYRGEFQKKGLPGYSREGYFEITQRSPQPLAVNAYSKWVRV